MSDVAPSDRRRSPRLLSLSHLTSALWRAASAIATTVVSGSHACEAGPPSARTRSHGITTLVEFYDAADERVREQSRARVLTFARSLRALPLRDAKAVRVIRNAKLTLPAVAWASHKSASARLEHSDLLPRLYSSAAKHSDVPYSAHYEAQHALRKHGRAHPVWQYAPSGTVTLPHVDFDIHGKLVATYLVVVKGEELIVAWNREDLHESEVLSELPSLHRLHQKVDSLTILSASAGDVIYMPPNTVHMVVTISSKCHLAYHLYE